MKTKKISVSELRNDLKSILKIVQGGTHVIIEAHGKSIAEIRPLNVEEEKKFSESVQKTNQLKLLEIGSKSYIGDIESPGF